MSKRRNTCPGESVGTVHTHTHTSQSFWSRIRNLVAQRQQPFPHMGTNYLSIYERTESAVEGCSATAFVAAAAVAAAVHGDSAGNGFGGCAMVCLTRIICRRPIDTCTTDTPAPHFAPHLAGSLCTHAQSGSYYSARPHRPGVQN